jgi:hypothetical protein
VAHGFVRATDGTITTFDAPGAGTTPTPGCGFVFGTCQGTVASATNPAGIAAGEYRNASDAHHGYVRAPNGTFTFFDPPGAGTGSGQGTIPVSITPAGAIAGFYVDANNVCHGFLRIP